MDNASDYGSEDSRFDSWLARNFLFATPPPGNAHLHSYQSKRCHFAAIAREDSSRYFSTMASKAKKHRAMGDNEWLSRLRRFATTGVWPSDARNRPAPRQKRWHDLYLKLFKPRFGSTHTEAQPQCGQETFSGQSVASSTQPATAVSVSTPASKAAAVSVSTQTAAVSMPEGHLAEHNLPGMDHADSLAEYLVALKNRTGLTWSNQQVSTIIDLWQSLLPYDQQRMVFAARHQDRLIAGKFRGRVYS
ncbi:uncharacterized protein LOC114560633 isoform X2 [Perca flavescens]|uniref:uncharacterized protein LOC114560633 isoform X2 n=1 Tax=Perca flavescens TaxID=8167 RepID=UPI00106E25CE|nr:uncharacterized protein LOC114560633 isoform X2 [Perca flavescens]